jgi:hypothetical protein
MGGQAAHPFFAGGFGTKLAGQDPSETALLFDRVPAKLSDGKLQANAADTLRLEYT